MSKAPEKMIVYRRNLPVWIISPIIFCGQAGFILNCGRTFLLGDHLENVNKTLYSSFTFDVAGDWIWEGTVSMVPGRGTGSVLKSVRSREKFPTWAASVILNRLLSSKNFKVEIGNPEGLEGKAVQVSVPAKGLDLIFVKK